MIAFGIGLLYRGGGVGAANANRRANQTLPYIYTQSRCALCARACVVFIIGIERRERTHMFEEMEISQDTTSNLVFLCGCAPWPWALALALVSCVRVARCGTHALCACVLRGARTRTHSGSLAQFYTRYNLTTHLVRISKQVMIFDVSPQTKACWLQRGPLSLSPPRVTLVTEIWQENVLQQPTGNRRGEKTAYICTDYSQALFAL